VDNGKRTKIGMTELIADNLNPEFVQSIVTDYFFENQQNMLVEIFDADDASQINNLSKQEFVGSTSFPLSKLLTDMNYTVNQPLKTKDGKDAGSLTVTAEELQDEDQPR
jgi:hypothetical protein